MTTSIKISSLVKAKNTNFKIEELKLFKPDGLKCRLYFSAHNFIEFDYIESDKDMTLDYFLNELGYVMTNNDIHANMTSFKKAYEYLLSNKIEIADKVAFADNSNAAKLTRSILKQEPHCDAWTFKSLAFDCYKGMGFSKKDLNEAIRLYS